MIVITLLTQTYGIIFGYEKPRRRSSSICGNCIIMLAIAVRDNVRKKKIAIDPMCPICGKEPETIEHLSLLCPWTGPVWFSLGSFPCPNRDGLSTIQQWLISVIEALMIDRVSTQMHISLLFYTLWNIWKARNDAVFNTSKLSPMATMIFTKFQCTEYLNSVVSQPNHHTSDPVVSGAIYWRPPRPPFLKINVDDALNPHTSKETSGVVCRDSHGNIIALESHLIFATTPLIAEAIAPRDTLLLGQALFIESLVVESGSLDLIQACRKKRRIREIDCILQDIWNMSLSFQVVGFTWAKREGNLVAHTIAALMQSGSLATNWKYRPPPTLRDAIIRDKKCIVGDEATCLEFFAQIEGEAFGLRSRVSLDFLFLPLDAYLV